MLFEFWERMLPDGTVHPDDQPSIDGHASLLQTHLPPGHINGRLKDAPIVACFLNPGYGEEDALISTSAGSRGTLRQQRTGLAAFPMHWPSWKNWLLPIVKHVPLSPEQVAEKVAILNLCPYASRDAKKLPDKLLRALPSSQVAKRYLHEILIPEARCEKRFVLVCRSLDLWGVRGVEESACFRIPRVNRTRGYFGEAIGRDIGEWLARRGPC